jgi:prepilin-type N-terminal cleavage/methylation domain-containing protein
VTERTVNGFSLVECMLSLALMGLISVILIGFVTQTISISSRSCERSDGVTELFVALAILARDARGAPSHYGSWRLTDKLILGLPLMSWRLSHGSLVRIEGGSSVVVARAIDDFSYEIDSANKRIVGVLLRLRRGKILATQYVCVQEAFL